jgi:hypothetical protein
MKPGDLLKISSFISAWSLEDYRLGNMYSGDIVIYLCIKNDEKDYAIVISKYGLCHILRECLI